MTTKRLALGFCLACGAACEPLSAQVFDFSKGVEGWKVHNYESRVSFCVTNVDNVSGFAAYVPGVKVPIAKGERPRHPDTAWGIQGLKIEATPGAGFSFTVKFRTTLDASKMSGSDEHSCFISFFGDDGEELPDYVPFALGPASNAWQTITVYGRIPDMAKSLRLQLGCDMPNIGPGDSIAISGAEFKWYPTGPSADCRVTIRDDGGVLVGGKPFFPIGIYGVKECDANGNDIRRAMRGLKEIGINLVHTYYFTANCTVRRFMDAAHEFGLKTWVPAGPSSQTFYEKGLLAERGHPSILAWYLGDDTGNYLSPAEIFRRHQICHTLDPDRITVQADYLHGRRSTRYLDYVNVTDAFLPEIYTVFVKEHTGGEVADVICDINTVKASARFRGAPNKSFWPIIQYFEGWRDWKRFPTAQELRAMTFAAIVHGGRGLTYYIYGDSKTKRADGWWGHGVTHTPEHWKIFSAVTREVAALHDDIAARDAAVQPTVRIVSGPERDIRGNKSVQCLLKETGLLLAVNSSTKDVVAGVSLPGGRDATFKLEPFGVLVEKNFK